MESISIYSDKFRRIINGPITNVLLEGNSELKDNEELPEEQRPLKTENNLSCSYCRVKFSDVQQQREHYKLDWHRYNLKQSLLSKLPITEEDFVEKTGNDDLSSISGSDSEKDDVLDVYALAQGKIFLRNEKKQVFSIYRCMLFDKKEEISEPQALLYRLEDSCVNNKKLTVLMLGGGHFAGAVFQGDVPILHKTFHCYTVRAGQGGSQSSRDGKSGGSQPKSAGASLRRYNEQALVQHVNSIVDSWRQEINQCGLIIYRASGPYNRSVLFGGSNPLLDRSDKRLRTIPFSTRRATFTEVKRVHSLLTNAQVFASLESASAVFTKQKSPENDAKRAKARSSCINRAKSREVVERALPGKISSASNSENDSSNLDNDNLQSNDLEVSFEDLQEFGDSLTAEQRNRGQRRRKPKKSQAKKLREQEEARKKGVIDILVKGNVINMKSLLEQRLERVCGENDENLFDKAEVKKVFINEILDESGNTMLHIAALNEHEEMIDFLLENEGDPCLKNKNNQTVYTCTQSKVIREALKQYARRNPTKFNYNKKILENAKKLKGTKIFISNDYPTEDYNKRKVLNQHLKMAKTNKCDAVIRKNELIVNGKTFTYESLVNQEPVPEVELPVISKPNIGPDNALEYSKPLNNFMRFVSSGDADQSNKKRKTNNTDFIENPIRLTRLRNEEISEKKKAQRKIKKEKEKEKKKENEIKRKENEEQDRFLKLSDREKRALAAEKRILKTSGGSISTVRCFLCACDITGKVPFEYSGNRFCSIDCLKAHRMQQPVTLS